MGRLTFIQELPNEDIKRLSINPQSALSDSEKVIACLLTGELPEGFTGATVSGYFLGQFVEVSGPNDGHVALGEDGELRYGLLNPLPRRALYHFSAPYSTQSPDQAPYTVREGINA